MATLLVAQNPSAYAAIGNPIYNNAKFILDLKHLPEYEVYELKIDNYYFDVDELKDVGFEVDKLKTINKKDYLTSLRKLLIINNFFIDLVDEKFNLAIKHKDTQVFINAINSKLIDTDSYKVAIMDYYNENADDIKNVEVIDEFLIEEERLRLEREAMLRGIPTKKSLQDAKVKRIKERDIEKQEIREKELQQEVSQKKIQIRVNQKKELSH